MEEKSMHLQVMYLSIDKLTNWLQWKETKELHIVQISPVVTTAKQATSWLATK
jgi:hypothetical protein